MENIGKEFDKLADYTAEKLIDVRYKEFRDFVDTLTKGELNTFDLMLHNASMELEEQLEMFLQAERISSSGVQIMISLAYQRGRIEERKDYIKERQDKLALTH